MARRHWLGESPALGSRWVRGSGCLERVIGVGCEVLVGCRQAVVGAQLATDEEVREPLALF